MARHRAEHESNADAEASDDGTEETAGTEPTADESADDPATDDTTDEPADTPDDDTANEDDAAGGDEDDDDGDERAAAPERTKQADTFWSDVRVEPIEVALPGGVGYTLRAYAKPADLSPVPGEEPEEAPAPAAADDAEDERDTATEDRDADDEDAETDDEESDEDEEAEEEEPEEVPVFLSRQGRLLVFHSPEGLVEFLRSNEPHALRGIETYDTLARRIEARFVAPSDEDRYELDLLVRNLRGGHDAWDAELIVSAGELARDLAYALRMHSVLTSLAPGSPLDDLDNAMRGVAGGGLGRFRARRQAKKIGAQQAALGWRTIIGKVGAAVDWRD